MFTARGADEGLLDPRVAVDVDAQHHPRRRRRLPADQSRALGGPADSHLAAGVARRARRATRCRPSTPAGDVAAQTAAQAAAGRRPSRAALRAAAARRSSTATSPSSTCRILAMTTVGMLGLFYISTFIDMSDKLFKGQTTLGDDRRVPVLVDAGVPVLHHRARGAALGAGHRRPADQEQRADRDARVRHQPVSHGAADGGVRARRQRGAVRHGRTRARHGQPARRSAEAHHSHRLAANLRRAQPQVDRRQQRRGVSLPVLRSAQPRAEQPVGVRVRSEDARAHSRACSCSKATYDRRSTPAGGEAPKWALDQGWSREFDRQDRGQQLQALRARSARASSPPTIS